MRAYTVKHSDMSPPCRFQQDHFLSVTIPNLAEHPNAIIPMQMLKASLISISSGRILKNRASERIEFKLQINPFIKYRNA